MNGRPTQSEVNALRQQHEIRRTIDVSANCIQGSKSRELVEDGVGADITGVEDHFDILEHRPHHRVQPAVGIGDETDPHDVTGRCSDPWRALRTA